MIFGITRHTHSLTIKVPQFLVALCLFLFVQSSYAECTLVGTMNKLNISGSCEDYIYSAVGIRCGGKSSTGNILVCDVSGTPNPNAPSLTLCSGDYYLCSQNSADSLNCVNGGGTWTGSACQNEPDADETCADEKAQCEKISGATYTPQQVENSDGSWSCTGLCDVCGTQYWQDMKSKLAQMCCEGGQAPPSFDNPNNYCSASISDDGQVWGTGCSKSSGNCSCRPADAEDADMSRCLSGDYDYADGTDVPSEQDSSSAPRDTVADGEGDWEYDYYPILDTIRDTLVKSIAPSLKSIATCLTTGQCVPQGDTVIVNSDGGFDTALVEKIQNKVDSVATTVTVLNDSLRRYLNKQDSILKTLSEAEVDSLIKYQNLAIDNIDSALYKNFSHLIDTNKKYSDKIVDSMVYYLDQGTKTLDSSIGSLHSSLDTMWNSDGKDVSNIGDTSGVYDGYLDGTDTESVSYLQTLGKSTDAALSDSTFAGIYGSDSVSSADDTTSYDLPNADSLHQELQKSVDTMYTELEDTLETYFDTLRKDFVLIDFDSAIVSPLGMRIPNTNTCPEDCFSVDLSNAGKIYSGAKGFSWGLCRSWSVLGNMNVLEVIRLLLRIITAFSCVYIGVWFIAGRNI